MADTAQGNNEVYQDFILYIVKMIVEHPDEVVVEVTVDEMGTLLTLKVNKEDMGRVVGKEGKTAKALRTLLRTIGSRRDERVNLKILEPEGGTMGAPASDPLSTGFEDMVVED